MLDWARALGSVGWTMPPRGRRPIAVDEAAEKVNGREVCAWAAMDVDTRELPAIEATWSRGLHGRAPLLRVLGACTNKPAFVVEGAAVLVGPPGARSGALPRGARGRERG
ncbi:MAG: hypothetical protein RXQ62_05760 [Nitrososphaeria archaeon]